MKIKLNYFVIPILVFAVAVVGGFITRSQQAWLWYKKILALPDITPPSWVFPIVWNIIFLLTCICVLWVWNSAVRTKNFWLIIWLFVLNGILNVLWSYLFFGHYLIGYALFNALALEFTVIALIILIVQENVWPALLLIPYALWGSFAIYLNYLIWQIN